MASVLTEVPSCNKAVASTATFQEMASRGGNSGTYLAQAEIESDPQIGEAMDCFSTDSETETGILSDIVAEGLGRSPKKLPPWLFYDDAGSELFDQITFLPEYYLTRTERGIFEKYASEMVSAAAGNHRLRLMELGAGSADKTRLLLSAALAHQGAVAYQPVDVSAGALDAAQQRLLLELPEVVCEPLVADYTRDLQLDPCLPGERRMVLYIGSSIGNFDRDQAAQLLKDLHDALEPGDTLLLGVDLAPSAHGKTVADLMAAYYDSAGVTGQFNKNMLTRLNRELGAEFDLDSFRHKIAWNAEESRIEMHLESCCDQTVYIAALDQSYSFAAGETIHTENSNKYRAGEAEELLGRAGFDPEQRWMDAKGWFAVYLASRV
jgi:dimethylhistidine N-methyltransferase